MMFATFKHVFKTCRNLKNHDLLSAVSIFGNLRQFLEILGKCSGTFVWPLEQFWKIFGKWLEIFGKSSKTLSECSYYKKNITR